MPNEFVPASKLKDSYIKTHFKKEAKISKFQQVKTDYDSQTTCDYFEGGKRLRAS